MFAGAGSGRRWRRRRLPQMFGGGRKLAGFSLIEGGRQPRRLASTVSPRYKAGLRWLRSRLGCNCIMLYRGSRRHRAILLANGRRLLHDRASWCRRLRTSHGHRQRPTLEARPMPTKWRTRSTGVDGVFQDGDGRRSRTRCTTTWRRNGSARKICNASGDTKPAVAAAYASFDELVPAHVTCALRLNWAACLKSLVPASSAMCQGSSTHHLARSKPWPDCLRRRCRQSWASRSPMPLYKPCHTADVDHTERIRSS